MCFRLPLFEEIFEYKKIPTVNRSKMTVDLRTIQSPYRFNFVTSFFIFVTKTDKFHFEIPFLFTLFFIFNFIVNFISTTDFFVGINRSRKSILRSVFISIKLDINHWYLKVRLSIPQNIKETLKVLKRYGIKGPFQ